MDQTVKLLIGGVHNLLPSEEIPNNAAQDSLNFLSKDGKVILAGGRTALGAEGAVGEVTAFHKGYKTDGTTVKYAKFGTTIKYYDGSAWQTCISGLTSDAEYSATNYQSLAGSFTFFGGIDGLWKVVNSHPADSISMYDSSENFKGKIMIDKGTCFLWGRETDKTGLYRSWLDRQDSTVYTSVSSEAVGALGSTAYSGTLAFKAGDSKRTCFGITVVATVAAGTETFTDNYLGVLTSNYGGTGTINYSTGAYSVTFSDTTTGAVTANYQWEDSTEKGVMDFTKSATRLAGEGFIIRQDEGGDAILNVLIGQEGEYYSLKEKSAYVLNISDDDLTATNKVYRKDMGLPNWRACISTNEGIIFMNTANSTNPQMTILRRNQVSSVVEPAILFPHFDFALYDFTDASMTTYDRWTVIFCKTVDATTNNRMLLCNVSMKSVDMVKYNGKQGVQDGDHFYISDSNSYSVYEIFTGFDDMGLTVEGYWHSKDYWFETDNLKKLRKLRFKGHIDPDQVIYVYSSIDKQSDELIGTIRGDASYVNYSDVQAIGSTMIGEGQIGGDDVTNTYSYFTEIKLKTPKFRTLSVRLEPQEIGYFDFDYVQFHDVLTFENRMPKLYRQKQNVSVPGGATNQ